jgi:hypothetical protein
VNILIVLLFRNKLHLQYEMVNSIYTFTMFQVELKEGPLEQFSHEMEPFIRKQGLPVRLNKGL